MFVPFAWSVITSFKTLPDSFALHVHPPAVHAPGWDFVFNELDPSMSGCSSTAGSSRRRSRSRNVVLGSIAGYAFARLRFPGREILFLLVLATLMIPDQLRLVPVYLILNGLGLTGVRSTSA